MRWRVLEIGAGGGGLATALPGKPVKSVVVQDSSQNPSRHSEADPTT
jgi:hypothetical protein